MYHLATKEKKQWKKLDGGKKNKRTGTTDSN